jgi:hypothetical protein
MTGHSPADNLSGHSTATSHTRSIMCFAHILHISFRLISTRRIYHHTAHNSMSSRSKNKRAAALQADRTRKLTAKRTRLYRERMLLNESFEALAQHKWKRIKDAHLDKGKFEMLIEWEPREGAPARDDSWERCTSMVSLDQILMGEGLYKDNPAVDLYFGSIRRFGAAKMADPPFWFTDPPLWLDMKYTVR